MTRKDKGGRHADGFVWFGNSSEAHFIEKVDMSQRGAGGDKISFVGVVTDAVNFTVVLDLMLDHYPVGHTLVILSDCFRGT